MFHLCFFNCVFQNHLKKFLIYQKASPHVPKESKTVHNSGNLGGGTQRHTPLDWLRTCGAPAKKSPPKSKPGYGPALIRGPSGLVYAMLTISL